MDFTASVEEMRAHQKRLDSLADSASQTADKAVQTGLEGLPLYGIFCSPIVVPQLAFASAANAAAIKGVHLTMAARQGAMGLTADAYQATEDAAVAVSEGLKKVIE